MTDNAPKLGLLRSPTMRRLIRAYGPVVLIAVGFLLVAILVPTLERTVSP